MPATLKIIRHTYRDSVSLMQLSSRIAALPGVRQASAVMATEGNIALLREVALIDGSIDASPNDILIVVEADAAERADAAIAEAERELAQTTQPTTTAGPSPTQPRSIQMALSSMPEANLALISTPGDYAGAEALKALRLGLHVMLFSDNVSLADEAMLKREAEARELLLMGPDCGTAIIDGVPLGFANAVRRGGIGVIGASGTGMQQVTALIHRLGAGVSHALGTGGRDVRTEIGGVTMLRALDELAADAATRVIVLVSKPPARDVAERVLARAQATGKPTVACFLGAQPAEIERARITPARTLEEAAKLAVALEKGDAPRVTPAPLPTFAMPAFASDQRHVRGLYSGGTFCYEATMLLAEMLGEVHSNTPVGAATPLADVWQSRAHTLIDLGEDEFTRGRPHPMIDHRLRNERIVHEAADPRVAVILLDVVLGYGAHPDPAAEMLPALRQAQAHAAASGRAIAFVAFVCGTERDPQGLERQQAMLREGGVILADSNAQAVRIASAIAMRP
jgi:FdrA protein